MIKKLLRKNDYNMYKTLMKLMYSLLVDLHRIMCLARDVSYKDRVYIKVQFNFLTCHYNNSTAVYFTNTFRHEHTASDSSLHDQKQDDEQKYDV